jgi:glycosyltransferase involved in cell wall biosynthesis
MRPLGDRQKALARRLLGRGPLRPAARFAWHALLHVETRLAALRRPPPGDIAGVTAIIKTFERPERCRALIASIRRAFPALPIIIADDSRVTGDYPGAGVVRLPFDSGVGAGRQAALDRVETDFVLNLDDDFLFHSGTDLPGALSLLKAHAQVDLVGGRVIDLPLRIAHDLRTATLNPTDREPKLPLGTKFGPLEIVDKTPNFFLARTAAVRAVGWDPALKRLDHADFFTRARGRIASALWDRWSVLHWRDPFDSAYLAFREDHDADLRLIAERYRRA